MWRTASGSGEEGMANPHFRYLIRLDDDMYFRPAGMLAFLRQYEAAYSDGAKLKNSRKGIVKKRHSIFGCIYRDDIVPRRVGNRGGDDGRK